MVISRSERVRGSPLPMGLPSWLLGGTWLFRYRTDMATMSLGVTAFPLSLGVTAFTVSLDAAAFPLPLGVMAFTVSLGTTGVPPFDRQSSSPLMAPIQSRACSMERLVTSMMLQPPMVTARASGLRR